MLSAFIVEQNTGFGMSCKAEGMSQCATILIIIISPVIGLKFGAKNKENGEIDQYIYIYLITSWNLEFRVASRCLC